MLIQFDITENEAALYASGQADATLRIHYRVLDACARAGIELPAETVAAIARERQVEEEEDDL